MGNERVRLHPIHVLTLLLVAAAPASADADADAIREAIERHAPALVRVEATTSLGVGGLPGLGEGARRTQEVSTAGLVVAQDGLVVFPARALDPAGDAWALLGARPRPDVLAVSVVGADGRVREATWVGRDPATGLAFVRVVEAGRAGLAPVVFGQAAARAGDPLLVLSLGSRRLGRPATADVARVSFATDKLLGTTPRLPHALGGLVVLADGTPLGLLAPLPDLPGDAPDLLRPDALADARAGHVVPRAVLAPLLEKPPAEPPGATAARRDRAWLGVRHEVLTPELATLRGLDLDVGVRVVAVFEGPAKLAGIQPGDVLVKLDGEALDLESGESFDDLVEDLGVGTKAAFTVYRKGQQAKQVEVELRRGPTRPRDAERVAVPEAGLLVRAATFYDAVDAGLPPETPGAVVVELEPDGAASRAGLRADDLILKREGEPVTSLRDLRERLQAPGAQALTIRRRGEELTLRVRR